MALDLENAKKKEAESSGRDVFLAVNRNRQLTYSFHSRIYEKEMTVELLKEMREKGSLVLNGGSLPWVPDKELGRGWRILGEYMNGLKGNNLEQARLELAVDYASLFLGVKGKVWHPSESAYRSKGHLVMQDPIDK